MKKINFIGLGWQPYGYLNNKSLIWQKQVTHKSAWQTLAATLEQTSGTSGIGENNEIPDHLRFSQHIMKTRL